MDRSNTAGAASTESFVSLSFDREMSAADVERIKQSLGARTALQVPPAVGAAYDRAREVGFSKSSRPEVGALMAVLAAAVPAGGRILELGTGVGVGLAWVMHGLRGRVDVDVVSVEVDREQSELVSRAGWPKRVSLVVGDAREVLSTMGTFDLVFLDIPGGLKASVIDEAVTALRPGGQLLIDDMNPYWSGRDITSGKPVGRRDPDGLLEDPRMVCSLLQYSSGMILGTRLSG
ncbi:O-methyltransferase [Streptomyces triticiradicis]|uniref:Methyltransferase domain-containing protein n=1 Tax=Streptomyces triticiradicis TaxID=2651189 RepID=A0A7J5DF98_9ACTN|nr:class I SAM-dependent methyltransferase [Streptomyces triticiradicis]KAB1987543.1 methyltransferase domain-containing protein [Streptomyces triticiradicis]